LRWGLGAFSGEVVGSFGVNLRWGLGLRPKKFGLFPARFLFFWGPAVSRLLDIVLGVDLVVGLLCLCSLVNLSPHSLGSTGSYAVGDWRDPNLMGPVIFGYSFLAAVLLLQIG
jgi:hypothetical protein